jgi:hypothetical protein
MRKIKKYDLTDRRQFLYNLGAFSTLVITGYFVGKLFTRNEDVPSEKPKLANVQRLQKNGRLFLSGDTTTCTVNKTGKYVVDLLDGRNTLSDICCRMSQQFDAPHTGDMEAAVAGFICQLGMAGFLASPYYVTIHDDA